MLLWEKEIPEYFTDRRNIVSFVLFTAIFALVFINIYAPFGVGSWLNVTDFQLFFYSSIVILIGMLVIAVSRLLMYLLSRKKAIRYGEYALWIIGEILSMAFVYTLIQRFFLQGQKDFMVIMKNTVRITAFIILLPYVIYWLYLSFKEKYVLLEKMSLDHPENMESLNDRKQQGTWSMIPFLDEKGILRFSVKREDLLYLEAADNYVLIHYLEGNKKMKYMIRTTLKRIEQEFSAKNLVRCHRSFIINIDHVRTIRREKEGLIINFESPVNITVPISKTYLEVFIRKLSNTMNPDE
jgi:DNA-binding LytR/AlgR family response regulator